MCSKPNGAPEAASGRACSLRIFVTTNGLVGHINSVVGIAAEARRRGHHVCWAATGIAADVGMDAGLRELDAEILQLGTSEPLLAAITEITPEFMLCNFVEGHDDYVDRLEDALRAQRADVVVYDMACVWAAIAAHRIGVPYVGIPQGWPLLVSGRDHAITRDLQGPRDALFRRLGVPPHRFVENMCVSPWLNLLATTSEVACAHQELPATYEVTGPTMPPPATARPLPPGFPAARPLVYVAFGTLVATGIAVYRTVVEACAELGVACVVSCRLPEAAELEGIGSTRVYPYVPQMRVLEEVSAAVLHGGTNSLNEAIWSGVPSLVVPFMADQFDGAVCVQRAGAGRELLLADLTVESVARALEALLAPSAAQRARMAQLQQSYRAADGNARAVDAIERIATAPVLPGA